MSLYSFSCKTIGGSKSGARATASSWCAYVMREAEYGNKDGFLHSEVLLPKGAPAEWRDPRNLWRDVDAIEGGGGRTGREFMIALQRELTIPRNLEALRAWAQPLVDEGACVHIAVHEADDERNVHAHVTVTTRAWDSERGQFKNKYETAYPVRREGEPTLTINAELWKAAKKQGYEKLYLFKDGVERTKTECLAEGLDWKNDRASQRPVQTNVKTTDWDTNERLLNLRESWASECNRMLAQYAPGAELVDHRSYAEQGIEKLPHVHLGARAHELEQRGEPTVLGEKNRQIDEYNKRLASRDVPAEQKQELLEHGYDLIQRGGFRNAEQVRQHTRPILQRVAEKVREVVERVRVRLAPVAKALNEWVAAYQHIVEAQQRIRQIEAARRTAPVSERRREADSDLMELTRAKTDLKIKSGCEPSRWKFKEHRNWQNRRDEAEAEVARVERKIADAYGSVAKAERVRDGWGERDLELAAANREREQAAEALVKRERDLAQLFHSQGYTLEQMHERCSEVAVAGMEHSLDNVCRWHGLLNDLMPQREQKRMSYEETMERFTRQERGGDRANGRDHDFMDGEISQAHTDRDENDRLRAMKPKQQTQSLGHDAR